MGLREAGSRPYGLHNIYSSYCRVVLFGQQGRADRGALFAFDTGHGRKEQLKKRPRLANFDELGDG